MVAAASDFFKKVGSPGNATTLAAPGHTIGGTSFTVNSTSLWPTDTGVTFAIDTATLVNGVQVRDSGSYTVWDGVVASGTTITGAILRYGTDQNYPAGSTTRVYILPTSTRENKIIDGLLTSLDQDGTLKAGAVDIATVIASGLITDTQMATAVKPVTLMNENTFDHVAAGIVITADSVGVNKNYSISSGVVYMAGKRLTVAAVSAQTVGASKDRYVDLHDNGDGTAVYITNEVNNNIASQALAAGDMRVGIVVAGATTIATTASINQGQEDRILPIASSIAYTVTDSLGNLICPRDPNRKILGYRQILTNFTTTSTTAVAITGLTAPVIIPTGRKIKVTLQTFNAISATIAKQCTTYVYTGATAGTLTTVMNGMNSWTSTANFGAGNICIAEFTPSSTSLFITGAFNSDSGGGVTSTFGAAANFPGFIKIELN